MAALESLFEDEKTIRSQSLLFPQPQKLMRRRLTVAATGAVLCALLLPPCACVRSAHCYQVCFGQPARSFEVEG